MGWICKSNLPFCFFSLFSSRQRTLAFPVGIPMVFAGPVTRHAHGDSAECAVSAFGVHGVLPAALHAFEGVLPGVQPSAGVTAGPLTGLFEDLSVLSAAGFLEDSAGYCWAECSAECFSDGDSARVGGSDCLRFFLLLEGYFSSYASFGEGPSPPMEEPIPIPARRIPAERQRTPTGWGDTLIPLGRERGENPFIVDRTLAQGGACGLRHAPVRSPRLVLTRKLTFA